MKIGLSAAGKIYSAYDLFQNTRTWKYGYNIFGYFNTDLPELDQYFE